jgi:chromatin remodeling complex protein RSC6
MTPCSECGEHFPFEEMMEWDGDMFCKKDYGELKSRADEEDRDEAKKEAEEKKRDDEEGIIGEKPSESEEANASEGEEDADSDKTQGQLDSEMHEEEESFLQKLSRFLGIRKDKK